MKKIAFVIILTITFSCKTTGTYFWNENSSTDYSYLKLNIDETFEYYWFNDIAGIHEIKGSWKNENNIYLLKENNEKYSNNELTNIGDKNKNYIKFCYPNNEPIPYLEIEVDGIKKSANFDGIYFFENNLPTIIKTFDSDRNLLLGEFIIDEEINSSYTAKIDYLTIIKSSCYECPFNLERKGKKLYPLNDKNKITRNYFFRKKNSPKPALNPQ